MGGLIATSGSNLSEIFHLSFFIGGFNEQVQLGKSSLHRSEMFIEIIGYLSNLRSFRSETRSARMISGATDYAPNGALRMKKTRVL